MPPSGWHPRSRPNGRSFGRVPQWQQGRRTTISTPATIRQILNESRAAAGHAVDVYERRLGEIPPPLAQRKLTFHDVLHIISWHEAHHDGQAHATLNSYRASQA